MAILTKDHFDDYQDVSNAPSNLSDYKNYETYKNHGKWVLAKLKENHVKTEGRIGTYYLLFEITGVKPNTVDAPNPPFGTGNGTQ